MKSTALQLTVLAAVLLGTAPAMAQTEVPMTGGVSPSDGVRGRESTYETTRGMGMGTGARASAASTSALAYNPANLAQGRVYHIGAFGTYRPGIGAFSFGSTVVDSVTNKLAMGLSARALLGGDESYRGYDFRLGAAMPLSQAIAIGVSARYANVESRVQNGAGENVGDDLDKYFGVDAAIRVTPTEGLNIAALGYNLIRSDSGLAPLLLGGSAAYTLGNVFTIGADVLVDLSTWENNELIWGGGAEYLAGGSVPLRLGYRREEGRDLHQITGAIGWVDQSMGVDFSIRQDIASDTSETEMMVSFRYHVQ